MLSGPVTIINNSAYNYNMYKHFLGIQVSKNLLTNVFFWGITTANNFADVNFFQGEKSEKKNRLYKLVLG